MEFSMTPGTGRGIYPGPQAFLHQALHSALMRGVFADSSNQIRVFVETWEPLCPVIAVATLNRRLSAFLPQLHSGAAVNVEAHLERTALFTVSTILLIQAMVSSSNNMEENLQLLKEIQEALYPSILSLANLDALQSIALFSLYAILTSQYNEMVKLSGVMVQMAKSLGLHRHARRFKFGVGEVESRKRLWWWIYMFDMITATIHGLPKVIHDADVDTDYPVDCELKDSASTELSFPLPGESTSIGGFITLARLSRLLSRTLAELYTTTERRDSVRKMELLRDELKAHGNGFITSTLSAGEVDMGEEMQLETPASTFGMGVDGSDLGELGQLDSLDWIFDFNPEIPPTSG
ncbi:hypothetical protein Daus18300_003891 [Diaporthe australafricana]|uniref:Xylanolytic transcriptional activator regulatory domain-containing protein n=1 Tax=Diaporthe australafricana TaxID=127596 RepID=A0ABR3XC44_9PEZI